MKARKPDEVNTCGLPVRFVCVFVCACVSLCVLCVCFVYALCMLCVCFALCVRLFVLFMCALCACVCTRTCTSNTSWRRCRRTGILPAKLAIGLFFRQSQTTTTQCGLFETCILDLVPELPQQDPAETRSRPLAATTKPTGGKEVHVGW